MRKTCVVCGKSFNALTSTTCCSTECVRARDLEHARECSRQRRAKDPERVRKVERRYRAAHPERVYEVSRKYAATHPERMRKAERKYGATNRGRALQAATRHNRRVRLNGILMTTDMVLELKSEYSGFCPYCGSKIAKGHIDHIVPVSKGGTNKRENLVWVCKSCNVQKGNRSLLAFLLQRQKASSSLRLWEEPICHTAT